MLGETIGCIENVLFENSLVVLERMLGPSMLGPLPDHFFWTGFGVRF